MGHDHRSAGPGAAGSAASGQGRTGSCGICGRQLPMTRLTPVELLRPRLADRLDASHPEWRSSGLICDDDIQTLRRELVAELVRGERGALSDLDREVVEAVAGDGMVSADPLAGYDERIGFGARVADRVAAVVGSWPFIIGFLLLLGAWMALNVLLGMRGSFDPYPFILLNLVLSCVAAIQAPLIMMSQSRSEAKDRLRAQNDYQVNLKAELEIRRLHEKFDHHLMRQWERLAEIQSLQTEIMDEMNRRKV